MKRSINFSIILLPSLQLKPRKECPNRLSAVNWELKTELNTLFFFFFFVTSLSLSLLSSSLSSSHGFSSCMQLPFSFIHSISTFFGLNSRFSWSLQFPSSSGVTSTPFWAQFADITQHKPFISCTFCQILFLSNFCIFYFQFLSRSVSKRVWIDSSA